MPAPSGTTDESRQSLPRRRGLLACIIDRIALWLLGYPPERCTYTILSVRIPVSDGINRIELAGDLLQPVLSGREKLLGTVLQISPYGRGLPIRLNANAYASRGYQVLIVSSRGTFGSGGDFDPFRNEVEDGKGIVDWMRNQEWYTGTFATVGGSYLSFTQWGVMAGAPKDMIAAVTTVSMHDASRVCWETGALNLDIVRWAGNIAKQERSSFTWKALTRPKLEPVVRSVPLAQKVRAYLGDDCQWVDHLITRSDVTDPHYAPMQLGRALDCINVPILIITGWYDIFLEQSVEQYSRLKRRGVPVAMTSGPWSHIKCALNAKANRLGFDWIEQHLGGRAEVKREHPVEYFVTGAKEWRQVTDWPPPCESIIFYLQADGRLTHQPTSYAQGSANFIFDPRNPTPTLGGNALLSLGAVDDSSLAKREDVLVFDSDPLGQDFEICGQATIELQHSTSQPYADIFVRVSDVKANGISTNVTEGYKRLDPKRHEGETVKLNLNNTSHRFLRGRKIRVMIAGGNFPQYARNLGSDDRSNIESEMKSVEHTVSFSSDRLSYITFSKVLDH